MKKAKKGLLVFAACLILLPVFFFATSRVLSIRKTQKALEEYKEVTQTINAIESDFVDEEGFVPPDSVEELLMKVSASASQMYKEGQLSDYSYAEGDPSVYMEVDGWLSIIYSPEIEGMMSGSSGETQIYTFEPFDWEFYANYVLAGFKGPDEAADKVVCTFDGFRFDHNVNGQDVSIDAIKEIEPNSVILWFGHGGYSKELGSILSLGTKKYDQYTILRYQREFSDKALCLDDKGGFYITPVFFEKYMPESCFEGSLVYLASCYSATDSRLAESIANKGARAILGNSTAVQISYNFNMVYSFFEGLTTKKPDGSYMTVSEALTYAKSENGENDIEYMKNHAPVYSYSYNGDKIRTSLWHLFLHGSEVRLGKKDDFTLPDMLVNLQDADDERENEDVAETTGGNSAFFPRKPLFIPGIEQHFQMGNNASAPDYSLYVPVIEKAIAERPYSGDDYGILYDLDKDGVEELFMLHTYSGGAIPEMGYSIYDINDGALVTRAEKQTLIVMAGGGGCTAGISETDGGTYFYAYSLQIGDVYADSVITVYDQSFSVYKTFEANMETEGTHITQDSYITSFSIDGSPCAVAEYKLLLSTLLPFDTACFQLENTGRQIGRFYNGQWYGETLTALLNRLKASAEPDVDETINGEDAYREVLDMFYRNIQNGWTELDHENWDDPCDPDSVSDYYLTNPAASISPKSPRSLSEVGYCIRDVGGDGVPELLVSLLYFSENDPGTICDLYTLSDGRPVHLASSDKVIRFYLAENGITCTEGTSITWVNGNYRIDPEAGDLKVNQAVISEGTFSTPTTWYYTETDSFDRFTFVLNYDEMINISEEEAQRIIASFPQHKAYPLTTFDQYRPGGQRVEKDKADENGSLNISVLEGTWANEFSEDLFALFYLTEFSSDGTVVQHGYRNIDKGRFQITGANTVVATFDDNYWDAPGVGLQKIADYSYTVTYTYDQSSDTLFADYSTAFENAVNSNANDGTLRRWDDGNDTVAGKDAAPKNLSESDAQRIAEWYWQDSLETPSEIWADIAAKVHETKTYQGKEFYYCTLTGRVDGHRTTLDYLYIDAETGDCYFGIDHPEELIYEGSAII